MLNVNAHQLKVLAEVNSFNDLLDRYVSILGEEALDQSLWRLECRDLEYRVSQLAFEISSAELDQLGIDSIAQYVGEDAEGILSAYHEIRFYLKFKGAEICADKRGAGRAYPATAKEKILENWKATQIKA